MADVKWTVEQKNAIEATGGTVLVSAAAGSGKTAVLVERVIDFITDEENPCGADEMLIVTFTNAAARQMKEKITKKLSSKIKDEPDNRYFKKQQILLSNAKICTIDSFCYDLLKLNYHKTNIEPGSRLVDDGEKKCLMSDAFEKVVNEYYEKQSDSFDELINNFSSSGNDKKFKEIIFSLYDCSCAYPFPEKWIKEISDSFSESDFKWKKIILGYVHDAFRYLIEVTDNLIKYLKEDDIALQIYGDSIVYDNLFFKEMGKLSQVCSDNEDWDKLMDSVMNFEFPLIGKKPRGLEIEILDYVKDVRNHYKKVYEEKIKKCFCSTSIEDEDDIKKIYPMIKNMSEFLLDFSKAYSQIKSEKKCIDFSDTLHTAINLLVEEKDGKLEKTDIAKQYSDKFRYILVDEYQDTNKAQDLLFEAVSRDKNNMFFVGDVKQSIYGFRQAMPELFIKKREEYSDYTGEDYPANIYLRKNFRSRNGIVKFVNFFFSQVISKDMGGIDYDENEELVYGADYVAKEENDVEINLLDIDKSNSVEAEAEFVAQRIKKIMSSGMQVRGEDGELRDVRLSDICILSRAVNEIGIIFAKKLNEYSIDCNINDGGNLLETTEIRTLFSFLKVINNPLDDIAILSVLMSPMFSFSADEIASLRVNGKRNSNLYQCVNIASENGDEKCTAFLNSLSKFRLRSICLKVSELIDEILDETGYLSIVLSMKDGKIRRNNLYLFRDYAENFSSNNNVGLSSFIRMIERMRKDGSKIPACANQSQQGDCVSIMSIHKSKGLEFPVCILTRFSKRNNTRDLTESVLVSPKLGIGIKGKDNNRMIQYQTINHNAIRLERKIANLEEEMRVLYVAMTRAKEKLIICISDVNVSNIQKKFNLSLNMDKMNPYEVGEATGYSDWLLACVMKHIDARKLREFANRKMIKIVDTDFSIDLNFVNSNESILQEETMQEKASCDKELVELIKKKIEYKYEYSSLQSIRAKRGASEVEDNLNLNFFASSRPAFLDKKGLTPAQRGTAMHLFMQHCDYENASKDIEEEITRVRNKSFINEIEAASLDRDKLNKFFGSNLAKRIFSSENILREKKFILNMTPSDLGIEVPENAKDEKIVIQGIIDCAFVEDGEIVVLDYKTDKVKSPQELRERYSSQLSVYTKAVKECFGMDVKETVIYSFHLNEEISVFN